MLIVRHLGTPNSGFNGCIDLYNTLSFTISGGAAPILPSVKQVAPKTWRISASADAIWFLRLKVITTDRPRSQALDKVLRPPGFFTNIFLFAVFKTKSRQK